MSKMIGLPATVTAAALGILQVLLTAIWLSGSEWLLDTVGGAVARWGRERAPSATTALSVVLLVKLAVALLPLGHAGMLGAAARALCRRRAVRVLGWCAAIALSVYGGVLTMVGLLVTSGVWDPGEVADPQALRWHAWLWDPWFLAWGVALTLSLRWAPDDRSSYAESS